MRAASDAEESFVVVHVAAEIGGADGSALTRFAWQLPRVHSLNVDLYAIQ